jgi:anti-sigma regulatory factor (Ser/Thr protein kinase)
VIGTPPQRRSARAFTATATAPRASRRFVSEAIEGFGLAEAVRVDAALVTSELATNAVLHARTDFTVGVALSAGVRRIEVRDGSLVPPVPRSPTLESSGHGLMVINVLASAWGTERFADGKMVWAELPIAFEPTSIGRAEVSERLTDEEYAAVLALQHVEPAPSVHDPIWAYSLAIGLVRIDWHERPPVVRLTPDGRTYTRHGPGG